MQSDAATTPISRIIWDLTYACPLRCVHCYSESGRRPARTLDRADMLRVVDTIVGCHPERISFAGGEPLLVRWWDDAARILTSHGIPVTVFVSGWLMNETLAGKLADSATAVTVSVDGPDAATHDAVRGRRGSFARAMRALDQLDRVKRERGRADGPCFELGMDYTMTRTGQRDLGDFVERVSSRFGSLDYIRIGAAMPVGLAQEERFVRDELLDDRELDRLLASGPGLQRRARNEVEVTVEDVRCFLPSSEMSGETATIAQIEPDGALRAFAIYEAKVGNVLEEPIAELWQRALAWRQDPFVLAQTGSVTSLSEWARATRQLDRRYGSAADRARIAQRGNAGAATD